ncbi:hypothetical protein OSTOST_22042, partial [Ostertagia ostertagi]
YVEDPPGSGRVVALAGNPILARAIPAGNFVIISASGTTVTVPTTTTITATVPAAAPNAAQTPPPAAPNAAQTPPPAAPSAAQTPPPDCMLYCPSIYRDGCYGNQKAVCATAVQAAAIDASTVGRM